MLFLVSKSDIIFTANDVVTGKMQKMALRSNYDRNEDESEGFLESLEPEEILTILVLAIIGCVVIFVNILFCFYRICRSRSKYSRWRSRFCDSCRVNIYWQRSQPSCAHVIDGNRMHAHAQGHAHRTNGLDCGIVSGVGMPGNARPYPMALPRYEAGFEQSAPRFSTPDGDVGINNVSYTSDPDGHQDEELPVTSPPSLHPSTSLNSSLWNAVPGEIVSNTELIDVSLQELFKVSERSFTHTICGKQVVSIAKLVGHEGDTLYLDNMGIFLRIPEGAIEMGHRKLIGLVLNWDLSDNPNMTSKESLVSPVVFVGPHGLKLNKECTLSFRHCAFDPRQIRVMRSETDLNLEKAWESVCDQSNRDDHCYFTQDECQLKINTFTLYTCIQQPIDAVIGKKWLQIAVFACPLRREINHHQIRVYFLNKTPCALQWATQNEAKFGGRLMCPEKVFLFDGNELDMLAVTRYVSKGWIAIDDNTVERISFLNIWHGHCPHISICYKRAIDKSSSHSDTELEIELSLHLFAYQTSREDDGEKVFIQVAEDRVTPFVRDEYSCTRHHVDEVEIEINTNVDVNNPSYLTTSQSTVPTCCSVTQVPSQEIIRTSDGRLGELRGSDVSETNKLKVIVHANSNIKYCEEDFLESADKTPRKVPHPVRQKLKLLLDPDRSLGSDWRDLAAKLELDQCIPKLERYSSPTEKLLNYIENRDISVRQLNTLFRDIGREDCATELEMYCYASNSREPVENEVHSFNSSGFHSGNTGYQLYRGDTSRTIAKHASYVQQQS